MITTVSAMTGTSWVLTRQPSLHASWPAGRLAASERPQISTVTESPAGRLPVTFPRSVGQLPLYYNHHRSTFNGYHQQAASHQALAHVWIPG